MKYGAKRDQNHTQILGVLRSVGIPVYDLSNAGCGIPDCLAWVCGQWHLFEVKNPNTAYGKRGLNPIQHRWLAQWRGGPVYILRTDEDALNFSKGDFHLVKVITAEQAQQVVIEVSAAYAKRRA